MINGILIKELRVEKGLTQDKLGTLIGAGGNIVSRWERGKATPSYHYIQKLSEIFDKPIDFFIEGNNCFVECGKDRYQRGTSAPGAFAVISCRDSFALNIF